MVLLETPAKPVTPTFARALGHQLRPRLRPCLLPVKDSFTGKKHPFACRPGIARGDSLLAAGCDTWPAGAQTGGFPPHKFACFARPRLVRAMVLLETPVKAESPPEPESPGKQQLEGQAPSLPSSPNQELLKRLSYLSPMKDGTEEDEVEEAEAEEYSSTAVKVLPTPHYHLQKWFPADPSSIPKETQQLWLDRRWPNSNPNPKPNPKPNPNPNPNPNPDPDPNPNPNPDPSPNPNPDPDPNPNPNPNPNPGSVLSVCWEECV